MHVTSQAESIFSCLFSTGLATFKIDQLLNEVEQYLQIIDLRATDKSRYFARTECNNCFIILLQSFL